MTAGWFERVISSIADRGRAWIRIPTHLPPPEQMRELARVLVSEKGEASGAALAGAVLERYAALSAEDRIAFLEFLSTEFAPDTEQLRRAAQDYLENGTPEAAAALAIAAEPPRQELLRRLNMGPGGIAVLVAMRELVLRNLRDRPMLMPLEADLKHLLTSWFNRGFLELRRIDWHTSAAVLEKLIAYEAVHEIRGWDDLRRRLAPDRRCFAFFHPAFDDEPLIFVEVALVSGLAGAIEPLLAPGDTAAAGADTAIFYSISNCQDGLRGISFGNFLIKQVVEELKAELPSLIRFSTLSPVPTFRRWLESRVVESERGEEEDVRELLTRLSQEPELISDKEVARKLELPLKRLCAEYLTSSNGGRGPGDPVARFHLRNGARLERINWRGNMSPRGLAESYGLMVNYLYDPETIEANHERFVRHGQVTRSNEVAALLRDEGTTRSVGNLLSFGAGRKS